VAQRIIGFSLGILLFAAGCGAPCGDACRKLINRCGSLDWENVDSCITECEGVRENLPTFDERQEYDSHVSCLRDTSCDRLDDEPGACGAPQLVP